MTVLVTGFEPFGGDAVNPTELAVRELADAPMPVGVRLVTGVLPVVYGECAARAHELIASTQPDVVLLTGVAAGRKAITPERIAINVNEAVGELADNSGQRPVNEPIVPGGPDGIFATLPIHAIVDAIKALGLPAAISDTAGTYICNNTMYAVLHSLRGTGVRAGFVHVPTLDVLPLESTVRGLRAAIEASTAIR